jgi:hypothetical protein
MENILKRWRNADGVSYNYLCMGECHPHKPPFLFSLFFGVVAVTDAEFSFSGFKRRKYGPRALKGKHHNYPKIRKKWL